MGRTFRSPAHSKPKCSSQDGEGSTCVCACLHLYSPRGWRGAGAFSSCRFLFRQRKRPQAFYERDSLKTSTNWLSLDLNLGVGRRVGRNTVCPLRDNCQSPMANGQFNRAWSVISCGHHHVRLKEWTLGQKVRAPCNKVIAKSPCPAAALKVYFQVFLYLITYSAFANGDGTAIALVASNPD